MFLNANLFYFFLNFNIQQKKIERRKMKKERVRKVKRARVVRSYCICIIMTFYIFVHILCTKKN